MAASVNISILVFTHVVLEWNVFTKHYYFNKTLLELHNINGITSM